MKARDVELILRGGPNDGVVIGEIRGLIPGFVGYAPTGERDKAGRYVFQYVEDEALDTGVETAPNGTYAALAALRNALPEIIAVVKAAELVRECSASLDEDGYAYLANAVVPALSALDEKLNGADEPPARERTQ